MHRTLLYNIDRIPYKEAHSFMMDTVETKRQSEYPEVLMLLEHEPVLTMGRASEESDILASREDLVHKNISVHKVERGGLVTYHGPGQIIAYPVFNLRAMKIGVVELVNKLEEVVLKTLSDFSISGIRKKDFRGVWTEDDKIASIGVAVRGGISYHGVALNYDPDLSHFELINPCGLNGVQMTSISKISGKKIDLVSLRTSVAHHFKGEFDLDLVESSFNPPSRSLRRTRREGFNSPPLWGVQ